MPRAFTAIAVSLAVAVLAARGLVAVTTPDVLDWDETYYASIASTAANGLGLYPYVVGYPSIPSMGGVGYIVLLYALACRLAEPALLTLRVVSFLVSLVAVAGVAVLTRRHYGSAAGLAALALTPALLVFERSNTIRLDVFAIAFVAWALVLHSHAAERPQSLRWHALLGFVCALGLEVHLHTAAATVAVGFAYLVRVLQGLKGGAAGRTVLARPLAGFAAGVALGAIVFVALSVAPDPRGYFRTAALARLSAAGSPTELNLTATMDLPRLAQTFLSPAIIVPKEVARYRSVFSEMRWWETLMWLAGLPAFILLRQRAQTLPWRPLLAGAVIGGGIVFNGSSALYLSAILPFFVPAVATLMTHGVGNRVRVDVADVSRGALAMLVVVALAILPSVLARTGRSLERLRNPGPAAAPAIVDVVKNAASAGCVLAGPSELYARYFMSYPKFVGTRRVEVLIGSTYYDLQNRIPEYWHQKSPDIVFGQPDAELAAYLADARYVEIAERVWRKPANLSEDCTIALR